MHLFVMTSLPFESQQEILGEVLLAMLLGGIIGLERELAQKPAGLRTHMLVAGVAALLVALGNSLVARFAFGMDAGTMRADPIRLVEAVVTAVGFLCAGAIFRKDDEDIEGLTTGASVLFAAALGICVAVREYLLASVLTVIVVVVLRGIGSIVRRLDARRRQREGVDHRP